MPEYPVKKQRYFLPHEGKQVTFDGYDDSFYAIVYDDDNNEYHVKAGELQPLPPQRIGEDVT